jgi:hypothetical protein
LFSKSSDSLWSFELSFQGLLSFGISGRGNLGLDFSNSLCVKF